MHKTIKAISWIIRIIWTMTLLLPIGAAFSISRLNESKAIGIMEPEVALRYNTFFLSSSFYVKNTGFFELANVNFTVVILNGNRPLALSSILLPVVAAGNERVSTYSISIQMREIVFRHMKHLTNDTPLNLELCTSFEIAHILFYGVTANKTISWRAPFHGLEVGEIAYNSSRQLFLVKVSFENHANFSLNGQIILEVYNNRSERIGFIGEDIDVGSEYPFRSLYSILVDGSRVTNNGFIRLNFNGVQILEREWSLR